MPSSGNDSGATADWRRAVEVLISVDYLPPDYLGPSFLPARELRAVLREVGWNACLFSVRDKLASLPVVRSQQAFLLVEELYPHPPFDGDSVGLRRALEEAGACFVGSDHRAIRRSNDKDKAKRILAAAGLEVPVGVVLREPVSRARSTADELGARLGFPAVLKPVAGRGGSLGVELVRDRGALERRVRRRVEAAEPPVLIEEYVNGLEVTAWVVGVEPEVRCFNVLTVDKGRCPIYSRKLKTELRFEEDTVEPIPPSEAERALVEATAVAAHRAVGARSYSRVDLIVQDGRAVVLEVNTRPTLSPSGGLAIDQGRPESFGEVLSALIEHALSRSGTK